MLDFQTTDLDSMMRDIIDIFHTDGVELVRLSGLYVREKYISNYKDLQPDELDNIVHKLKNAKAIDYKYILYCPSCAEVSYIVKPKDDNPYKAKQCDTCDSVYIPQKEISLYEYED